MSGILVLLLATPAEAAGLTPARPAGTNSADVFARSCDTALRQDIAFLASDSLEGRGSTTPGGRAAAAFLASRMRKLGLQPLDEGFRLEFQRKGELHLDRGEDDVYRTKRDWKTGFQNVVGVIPPAVRRPDARAILICAHYDHVGKGKRGGSMARGRERTRIHNGADDNASGVAVVLEVARRLAARPPNGPRPVWVALFDGEEVGLYGSKELAETRSDDIAAVINSDMVGRMRDRRVAVYGTPTGDPFEEAVAAAAAGVDIDLRVLPRHRQDTDHWPFFQKDVPYLFFHTGLHRIYHTPEDDADTLNYEGLAQVCDLIENVTRRLAEAEQVMFRESSKEIETVGRKEVWQARQESQPWPEKRDAEKQNTEKQNTEKRDAPADDTETSDDEKPNLEKPGNGE